MCITVLVLVETKDDKVLLSCSPQCLYKLLVFALACTILVMFGVVLLRAGVSAPPLV